MRAPDREAIQSALAATRDRLLGERTSEGAWTGRLATSALSTATASLALALVDPEGHAPLVCGGLDWLAAHANDDGGWGDTVRSKSNINTTCLGWAALAMGPEPRPEWDRAAEGAAEWIRRRAGSLEPARLVETILAFYGEDRTFSTPILTVLALAGRLGPREEAFRRIPALPFELAAFPPGLWRMLRLPVVSYAVPALVAIGQTRGHFAPPVCPLVRGVRALTRGRTLRVVERMQPTSGGFLEAAPLTSFVTACLASIGRREHAIVRSAVRFLKDLARAGGGWPIDTCLETWVTTLSINTLAEGGALEGRIDETGRRELVDRLLAQQYDYVHPFTFTPPGGWSWMAGDGAVPDADDTPGALLALQHLAPQEPRVREAAERGVRWLLGLQNRDGGVPSFCRGWGRLPFDRSAADLTAHTVRAWRAWRPKFEPRLARRTGRAIARAEAYLRRVQGPEGEWVPLWFGNEWIEDDRNPTYGTARVLAALVEGGKGAAEAGARGVRWILAAQGEDGGWGGGPGGPPSIEETGLAIDALVRACESPSVSRRLPVEAVRGAVEGGAAWLLAATEGGRRFEPAPIGLYFAKLWYSERLYPLIFAHAGLQAAARLPTPC